MLGFLPIFLSTDDPRPAKEQFHTNYRHGGGWHPFHGFKFNPTTLTLTSSGDPPMRAIAETKLRDERIIFFTCSWVMIQQPDGSCELARMD
jgi:hypothetical protein